MNAGYDLCNKATWRYYFYFSLSWLGLGKHRHFQDMLTATRLYEWTGFSFPDRRALAFALAEAVL